MAHVTIPDTSPRVQYTVGGTSTTDFSIPYAYFEDSDIVVYVGSTLKTLTTDYTITGTAVDEGYSSGTVVLNTGVTNTTVTVIRSVAAERITDFPTNGPFNITQLNSELDRLTATIQQEETSHDLYLKVPEYDTFTDLTLPDNDTRKGTVLGFNATTGDPEAGPTLTDVSSLASITADIATLADIEDGTENTDAIQTVAGISSNVTTVAGISGNVTTVAGNNANVTTCATNIAAINAAPTHANNAATSATNAATSESNAASSATAAASSATAAAGSATTAASEATDAATSATAAAGSATSAASSATTATTQASAASTSATNAATSETNAATSATAAASSASAASSSASAASGSATAASNAQTAAETAQAAAEAAQEAIDGLYLGAQASDPTLDNNGSPVTAGDWYYNTTTSVTRIYDGSTWKNGAVDTAGFLAVSSNLSDLTSASTARTNLGLGTAATTASTDYATAAQGALADSALQSSDIGTSVQGYSSVLAGTTASYTTAEETKLAGIETAATADQTAQEIATAIDADATAEATLKSALGLGTAAYTASTAYATAAQGTLADSAVQPADNVSTLTNDSGYLTSSTGVAKTAATGSGVLPAGTTAQRDVSPAAGYIRFNNTTTGFEGYDGSAWGAIGGGATQGLFRKADSTAVAWTKTGNGTAASQTAIYVEVNGSNLTIASGTTVDMPSLVAGTDYAIWAETDGSLQASSNHTTPPSANARKVGGFHYAAGSNASAQSGGDTIAQINEYSFWDLKFRPYCDPRGMALVAGGFWADIYLTGVDHHTNGTSKYNVTIADGSSPPKVPTNFGGNGLTTYGSYTWFETMELLSSHGKRAPTQREFMALAYGTTEASSIGLDPSTTNWDNAYVSKWGMNQSTGCMWIWADDRGGAYNTVGWNANTEGRGSEYNAPNAALFGGHWSNGSNAGSRCSYWYITASYSDTYIGSRGVCDHMILD